MSKRVSPPARLRADIDELSACWPAPGFDAGRTGHNPFEDRISPDTVDDLHQIWTAATMAVTSPGRPEEPVVSNQAVHVSAGRAL